MGYKELLSSLARQVEEEKAAMLGEADRRSRLILDEARREIGRLNDAFATEDFRDAALQREKIMAMARQEGELASLGARREAVEKVRTAVRERLGALRGSPSYKRLMETLIEEVSLEMGEVGEWIVDRRDVGLVEGIIKERKRPGAAKVSEGEDCLGGLTASSTDGRARLHNTFETRLLKAWSELEVGIGAHLEGER